MATAGTLLSDLQGSPTQDGDLVQKILSDMSIPTGGGAKSLPPPLPGSAPLQMAGMSTQQMTMDSRIPTSHMIGNEHPTSADFAAAMVGANRGPEMYMPANSMVPGAYANAQATMAPPQASASVAFEMPSKNFYGKILDEIKIPFVVALLFFVFSLPPIRVLVSHYVPSLIRNTGEYQIPGLLLVSAIVGLTFWILYRVVAPLLSI
jgi:hypothetical protein